VSTATLLDALRAAVSFQPMGERAGNLTLGRGVFDGRAVRVALVENLIASGSIGAVEAERLGALFRITTRERAPLVIYLDSAGARVSEGLGALGAFRTLYRAGLDAALSGVPMAAVLGRNCYGGSSMIAHLASHRLFGPTTQLAMSGPAILASTAGMDVLDEAFRAVIEATISGAARHKASAANSRWKDGLPLEGWLRHALVEAKKPQTALHERHLELGTRLAEAARAEPEWEALRRRDIEHLYARGCDIREAHGFLFGEGTDGECVEAVLGIVGKMPVGADRAWRFASAVWKLAAAPPPRLRVFLDCATHAARLDDERIVLSEFIADMSAALAVLAGRGTKIELTILGAAGGGVYVALAAPAHRVTTVPGATIQVLPGAAIAAILGNATESAPEAAEYIAAGVSDAQIKLGLPPGER
jgi:hypothetical protein